MSRHTVKHAIASANLFSILETTKANSVEPYARLSHQFTESIFHKAESVEQLATKHLPPRLETKS